MIKEIKKVLTAGMYAAEVTVHLHHEDNGWSPYLSVEDAIKLDTVRKALRRGDLQAAGRLANLYQLVPVAA